MREWYGGDRRIERTLLVLLIRASNRTEIVLGSRARKKMRESAVRRVARRANQLLAAGGEGAVDDALRHAVTAVLNDPDWAKGHARKHLFQTEFTELMRFVRLLKVSR